MFCCRLSPGRNLKAFRRFLDPHFSPIKCLQISTREQTLPVESEFISWFSSYRDIGQKRNFHTKFLKIYKNSISQRRTSNQATWFTYFEPGSPVITVVCRFNWMVNRPLARTVVTQTSSVHYLRGPESRLKVLVRLISKRQLETLLINKEGIPLALNWLTILF